MSPLPETKLPDKPSALIRVALTDLQKCLADPVYQIDMRHWHTPIPDTPRCSVCLAGAVMAQTLKVLPSTLILDLRHLGDSSSESNKLEALDYFRTGDIFDGLTAMGFQPKDDAALKALDNLAGGLAAFDADDPKIFFDDMHTIADALERCGY